MTREEALSLGYGDHLYHRTKRQSRGQVPLTVRVTGRVRTWKRSPDRLEIPVKHGMYQSYTLTERDLPEWYLSEADALAFGAASAEIQSDLGIPATDEGEPILVPRLGGGYDRVPGKTPRELLDLLTFMLVNDRTHDERSIARIVIALRNLGSGKDVDDLLDRYNRGIHPFRKRRGKGRYEF